MVIQNNTSINKGVNTKKGENKMLRTDKIFVKLAEVPRTDLTNVRKILEDKLKQVASATDFRIEQTSEQIEVILKNPISLPTVNKILNAFREKRMIIYDLHWKRETIGPFILGYLEIVVS